VEPPAGIEPATPSLPCIPGPPPCDAAFSQVVAHRKWCSYGVAAVARAGHQAGASPALPGLCATPRIVRWPALRLERPGIAAPPAPPPCRRSRWSVSLSRVRHPAAEGVKKQADPSATMPVSLSGQGCASGRGDRRPQPEQDAVGSTVWWTTASSSAVRVSRSTWSCKQSWPRDEEHVGQVSPGTALTPRSLHRSGCRAAELIPPVRVGIRVDLVELLFDTHLLNISSSICLAQDDHGARG
jgi:hypothetical protein